MFKKIKQCLIKIFESAHGPTQQPDLTSKHESNIKDLFVIGDLAGAPVIKMAMDHGFETIQHIASKHTQKSTDPNLKDIIIIGAGAAGLNAALAAQELGLSNIVLEKEKMANTIENFPEGKWVYAEPDSVIPKGKLWLDGAQKEDLINRWHQIIKENQLEVNLNEAVTYIKKNKDVFVVTTDKSSYKSYYVILATGQRGNPRKLKVPGEELEQIYHRLYSPKKYQNEDVLVVGGGNSAVEAALVLSEKNTVTLSYRQEEFHRLFKDNREKLNQAISAKKIHVIFNSTIKMFAEKIATLIIKKNGTKKEVKVPFHHAFILIGAELPTIFLKKIGLKLKNEWEGNFLKSSLITIISLLGIWFAGGETQLVPHSLTNTFAWTGALVAIIAIASLIYSGIKGERWSWLGISFLIWYTIYGAKIGNGNEFWPYKNWGYDFLSFSGRSWSFWYTVLYTALMTIFGIQALKRWGLDKKDRFQIWRYFSLISFQVLFFFIIPEFLFQWAVKFEWLGNLTKDPVFTEQAWRSYGIIYAWPLFFYTFFYNPHQIWIVWGIFLTLIIIPIFVLFQGKRYCSWICGCGGLAETFGDRWRHLAPKGKTSEKWEWMNLAVLIAAIGITLLVLFKDVFNLIGGTADLSLQIYRIFVDVWLVGILPVTLYPFLGGKVWCRYWCPLAKFMQLLSKFYSKVGISKFHIYANDKCIACNECSRYCQVGIDVMSYALKQEVLDNKTSSCIGCGICVTVCPMDTLSFESIKTSKK
jgi:putative YpdA family bacillithiol system oxidoreductase